MRDRMKLNGLPVSRRSVVAGIAAFVAVAPNIRRANAQERQIVVRDPGGPYALGFSEAFYKPFEKETGIKIVNVVAQHGPVSQIKSFVETGTYAWDMALLTRGAHLLLTGSPDANYLEELKVNPGGVPAQYNSPYFLAIDVIQSTLAFRTDKFSDRAEPKTWADLWNVKDFPGRRSLRRSPEETLEIALLADGVQPSELYPLDVDRAFRSLDRIRSHVAVWWTSGAQSSQLLKSGEVDLIATFNARAQAAIDDGAPAKIVWDKGLMSPEGWCILKGGPKVDLCREFIQYTTSAERQAVFTKQLGYGPSNPEAYNYIDKARAEQLPTSPANSATAIVIDDNYWLREKDRLTERFNQWVIG